LLVRGLLTFSRGGMVTSIIAILIVMIFPKAKAAWQDGEIKLRNFSVSSILITFSIVFVVFLAINAYTGNYLLYRYQGKTERSIQSGFEKKADLDQISSGRYKIMISDFQMFADYPALGVGVGHSVKVREQYGAGAGFHPHLEFSRLLAEHGLPGLALIVMIFIYPFYKIWHEPNNYRRSIMLLFMIVGLASTFHSAMRTMVTPLLFAFAFINYVPTNFDWRTELAVQKKRILRKRKQNELILKQQQEL
jgi:O-antigen ligase